MHEYRVVFAQRPGEPYRTAVYVEAVNDADALEQVRSRWTRADGVVAVHWLGPNRWSQRAVWIQRGRMS